MAEHKVVIIGASGPLGMEIVRLLSKVDHTEVIAAYRTERPGLVEELHSLGATPVKLELKDKDKVQELLSGATHFVFAPILNAAEHVLHAIPETAKCIFFSSNNVDVDMDAPVYALLRRAEARMQEQLPNAIILRPTMVYGHAQDRNLSRLMRTMQRWPIVVRPGNGKSRQQPLFYRDLAQIVFDVLFSAKTNSGIYSAAGPVPMTQKDLFHTVRHVTGKKTLILPVPTKPAIWFIGALQKLGLAVAMTPAQISRVNHDKIDLEFDGLLGTTPLEDGLKHLAQALTSSRRAPS